MKKKSVLASVAYDDGLIEDLKDPEVAVGYLNAILADTDKGVRERFLNALSFVAKAHGIAKLAVQTKLQRESLRKALSEKGNPTITTLLALLKAFGFNMRLDVSSHHQKSRTSLSDLQILQIQIGALQEAVREVSMKLTETEAAIKSSTISEFQRTETRSIPAGGTPVQYQSVGTAEEVSNVH